MFIKVITNTGREIVIDANDLKVQDRAGKGSNIFKLKKDEYIIHSYIVEKK